MLEAADVYMAAKAVIANYGMGVTQHKYGVETAKMIVNLLLLRGNIGKPGAGISPIRGHSNVQGQRTVGISEKTKLVPLDKLAELYGFEPPRWDGLSTVDACEDILKRQGAGLRQPRRKFPARHSRALANGARLGWPAAVGSDRDQAQSQPHRAGRGHLSAAMSRPHRDRSAGERTAGGLDGGIRRPVSMARADSASRSAEHALSEPAIIAGLAKATLKPNPKVDWDGWVDDYSRVRDAIERTYPDQFKDFNRRMFEPGGFPRPLAARERKWKTPNGKANFTVPQSALAVPPESDGVYELMTMRADGQFNTTIYTEDDRFRGIQGSRYVVLINPADMESEGLKSGDTVTLSTVADDDVERTLSELQVVAYDIPRRSIAGYYPECNELIPLWHYAEGSKVPAAKSVPVRISKDVVPEIIEEGDMPISDTR